MDERNALASFLRPRHLLEVVRGWSDTFRKLELARALLLAGCVAASGCNPASGSVVISEFMAANSTSLRDAGGGTPDWIEIHNRGDSAVNLEGWALTDKPDEPPRWRFPPLVLAPREFLVVFASGDAGEFSGQLHVPFKLKATQDDLALLSPSGTVEHAYAPYPDQKADVSFGLTGGEAIGFLPRPTPGAPNTF